LRCSGTENRVKPPDLFSGIEKRLATDAELARKRSFCLARCAAVQLNHLVIRQRFFAAAIGAALSGANRENGKNRALNPMTVFEAA